MRCSLGALPWDYPIDPYNPWFFFDHFRIVQTDGGSIC